MKMDEWNSRRTTRLKGADYNRNREDYEEHLRYIYENPVRWYYDELYTECKDEIDEKE